MAVVALTLAVYALTDVKSETDQVMSVAVEYEGETRELCFPVTRERAAEIQAVGGYVAYCGTGVKNGYCTYYEALKGVSAVLYAKVAELCGAVYEKPQNAELTVNSKKPYFTYRREKEGVKADGEKLAYDILAHLDGGEAPTITVKAVPADVTVAMLKERTLLRSRFSTDYSTSSAGRCHNVELAVSAFRGVTLRPGEMLSFNGITGERTVERGYKEAKIILGGKFVPGVGGGICQVSTTLYNAALLSGLKIAEVRRHSLPVSYVAPSRDAMVSGFSDLKFENNTPYPLYVFGTVKDKKITFEFYGEKQTAKYSIKTEVIEKIPAISVDNAGNVLTSTENLVLISPPKDGLKSRALLITEEGGTRRERIIRTDTYAAQNGVYEKAAESPPSAIFGYLNGLTALSQF